MNTVGHDLAKTRADTDAMVSTAIPVVALPHQASFVAVPDQAGAAAAVPDLARAERTVPDQARQQGLLAAPWGHPCGVRHLPHAPGYGISAQACQTVLQPAEQHVIVLKHTYSVRTVSQPAAL